MKKLISVLALAALVSGVICAVEKSAGVGLKYNNSFNKYEKTYNVEIFTADLSTSDIALNVFLDATYIELDLGYSMLTNASYIFKREGSGYPYDRTESGEIDDKVTSLIIGAIGKYPFNFSFGSVFPVIGVEYKLNVSVMDDSGYDIKAHMSDEEKDDYNEFWFKTGIGADINATPEIYVRTTAFFGYKLKTRNEQDWIDVAVTTHGWEHAQVDTTRFDIGASIGFRF